MQDEDGRKRHAEGAKLEGLRRDAVSELDQEEADRKADASAEAARQATAARFAFEEQQKVQAKTDAQDAAVRSNADEAAREAYDALLKREAEARRAAADDARSAGREWNDDPHPGQLEMPDVQP
jgi:dTMP kinase